MSATFDKVKEIIIEQLDVEDAIVTEEASLADDIGADSLDSVEIMMSLEEEFGVEIPEEDATKMNTVKDIVEYITSNK